MADDYGALVLLDYQRCTGRVESVEISLVETRFAAGRDFTLGQGPVDGAREAG
jgi:hypothetical protein